MAMSFSSNLIREEPARTHSPPLPYKHRRRPTTADASLRVSIPITSPASPSISLTPVPDSPGISSSSAAARQPRATHAVRAARSPRSPAAPPSSLSLRIPEKPSKSRGSSFFNFFSVKEPSQQAFGEYERRMRPKGPTNDGRIVSSGIPGVSSAKMPAMVPKVNSNWDGVPQVIKMKEKEKEKEKEKKPGGQADLGKYSRSISTAGSDASKATTSSTTSSDNSSVRFKPRFSRFDSCSGTGDLYGWESASPTNDSRDQIETADVKRDHRSASVSSRSRKMMALSSHPVRPIQVPESYLDTELPPLPSVLEQGSRGFSSPAREILAEPPAQSFSPTITSSESSPVTPHDLSPIAYGSSRQLGHFTDQHRITTTTLVIPAHDEVIIRSAGVQILGPPASARRKDKKPAPLVKPEPERFDPPDTPVTAVQSEKSCLSDQDRIGVVSATFNDPPIDSSAQVEIRSAPGPKTKKRNKIPLLFGK